jgi:hypothetical protein
MNNCEIILHRCFRFVLFRHHFHVILWIYRRPLCSCRRVILALLGKAQRRNPGCERDPLSICLPFMFLGDYAVALARLAPFRYHVIVLQAVLICSHALFCLYFIQSVINSD